MKAKITLVVLSLSFICMGLFAQIPKVYNKENTGAGSPLPPLPVIRIGYLWVEISGYVVMAECDPCYVA